MRTFSSTMVGGGVSGKDVGIAHKTTTQVGATIKVFHLFMQGYPHAGGMTTRIIAGEGINGTTNGYLTKRFSKTGRAGKRTNIGRNNKPGVSRVYTPGMTNKRILRNSKETMEEGNQKKRIKSRINKIFAEDNIGFLSIQLGEFRPIGYQKLTDLYSLY